MHASIAASADGSNRTDKYSARRVGRRWRVAAVWLSIFLVASLLPPTSASGVLDPSSGTLDDVPDTTPANFGDIDLTELQYGDPTENLALIQPPVANNEGSASLTHPLPVPSGRAGMDPLLALNYSSDGGNGWMGVGWDLSVGAISVDTTYGAPRYLPSKESETYMIDGDRLFPNAIRSTLVDRNTAGVKDDFVRQVETSYERIIRHGTTPGNYFWQVTDKDGNDRWYGGSPLGRDDSAILVAPGTIAGEPGGAFHWALTYVEDISGNVVRYNYEKITTAPIGRGATTASGLSLYLQNITYTGSVAAAPAVDRPPYRVSFLRDGDVAGSIQRKDVNVDARSGAPVVTRDLLRAVEVHYIGATGSLDAPGTLVRGYRFEYDTSGPFDKTLLTRVGQYGTGGRASVHAWHDINWFDEVTAQDGSYDGFAAEQQWDSDSRLSELNIAATSALGSSGRGGGDGGAYIGFNPVIPSKIGSFGGSFNISGGQTDELSMLVDLDGDSLPDKVTTSGGSVLWSRNISTPSTPTSQSSRFASPVQLQEIDSLGISRDIRIDLHVEAYPVVAIQVGGGFGFSFGERYFEDVNSDGRPDFIRPSKSGGSQIVYFNVLGANGVPRFVDSSAQTPVPLELFDSDIANAPIAGVSQVIADTSPRIDTVRRWIAPFTGNVRIEGVVDLTAGTNYNGDGVQVMVESGGARPFEATLSAAAITAGHDFRLDVTAGQAVYFRVHVISNGTDDKVDWSPTITYVQGIDATPIDAPLDANGLSQVVYNAAEDFTLFGRTGSRVALVDEGQATLTVTLTQTGLLSDDVQVVVRHRRNISDEIDLPAPDQPAADPAVLPILPAGELADPAEAVTLTYSLIVDPVGTSGDSDDQDWLELDIISDSPVDPNAFALDLSYVSSAPVGPPVVAGGVTIPGSGGVDILPNVRVFARTDQTAPYVPYGGGSGDVELDVSLTGFSASTETNAVASTATITVKTKDDGVIAKQHFDVSRIIGNLNGAASLTFSAPSNPDGYWVEVSVHDPGVASEVTLTTSASVAGSGGALPLDVPVQMHRPDVQGIFTSGNRGWAIAGYNADHADADGSGMLIATQFDFSPSSGGTPSNSTPVPTSLGSPASVVGNVSGGFPAAYPYVAWAGFGGDRADMWSSPEKSTLYGTGTALQAARLGAEVAIPGQLATGRPAPEMLSVSGDFNFAVGLIASISAAAGGGRALRDLQDLNGDGFADIRSGANIEFTGPRGERALDTTGGDNTIDTSIAVGGGLGGSPIAISSGDKVTNSGSTSSGSTAKATSTKTSRGMNLGLGVSISSQWTNPISDGEADEAIDALPGDSPDVTGPAAQTGGTVSGASGVFTERALIDMNGDGLPDKVESYSSGELWVRLGLGYRFADEAVLWTLGRANASKDISGTLSAGFQINAYEFAGGVAYTEGVGLVDFMWVDIDGDGVPDRMERVTGDAPSTTFGAAEGMQRPDVVYGTYPDGTVAVDAGNSVPGVSGVPLGQQMSVSRSTGLTGGADFSIYIGPICLVACYIVINPGIHGGYDRMTSQISMLDVNGDGYVDVVKSDDAQDISVRLNKRGKTNLVSGITNPIGGKIRLDYTRVGNTVEQPESMWVMSSVEVDDGRPGDGKSIQRSEYAYSGNSYDRLHRSLLGFSSVVERQVETTETHIYPAPGESATPLQTTLLRSYERDFLNGSPFDAGLMTQERLLDAAGTLLETTSFDWKLVNAVPGGNLGADAPSLPAINTAARLSLFELALAPQLTGDSFERANSQGQAQGTSVGYSYDNLGNVLQLTEFNESETEDDNTVTVMTYSSCTTPRSSPTIGGEASWVAVPATVTVHGGTASGPVLRRRDGSLDLCANAVPIRLVELVGLDVCNREIVAVTEMSFDAYGSYNAVRQPTNALIGETDLVNCPSPPSPPSPPSLPVAPTGPTTFFGCNPSDSDEDERYCVDYVYDQHRFTDVATVTDNHGVSSSATYDPLTGRLARRTDENGNMTEYRYDPQGRIESVVAPRERSAFLGGSGPATVAYSYGAPSSGHAWSVARHYDALSANGDPVVDTIDTATFVDGIGRVTQRKRDASMVDVATPVMIVEGAVDFDALGREVKEWYPVTEPVQAWPATGLPSHLTTYNTWTTETSTAITGVPHTLATIRVFDALDRQVSATLPDGSTESTSYAIAADPGTGFLVFAPTTTDPLGKQSQTFVDIRGLTLTRLDFPVALGGTSGDDLLATLPAAGISDSSRIAESMGTGTAAGSTYGTDPITTTYEYDLLGRLTKVTAKDLRNVPDPADAVTTHSYDNADNRISTNTPDGGLVDYVYTPAGDLARVVDPRRRNLGTAVEYSYDRDRLRYINYPDDTPDVEYRYGDSAAPSVRNVRGRVETVLDGSMVRDYRYDVDGNVASEAAVRQVDAFAGVLLDPMAFTTSWVYDSLGRVDTLTYPEGEVVTHEYDRGGMPVRLTSKAPQHDAYDAFGTAVPQPDLDLVYIDELSYDEFAIPTFARYGNGVETRWEHEPTRRFMTGVTTDSTVTTLFDGSTSVARPLQRLSYSYDKVGNVLDTANALYDGGSATSLDTLDDVPENNVPGPVQHAYTYDNQYRLTGAIGRYIDRQEERGYTYAADYAPNGNLLEKSQATSTTGTTGNGGGKGGKGGGGGKGGAKKGNSKKGDGTVPDDGTSTTTDTCETDAGSGGGAFNQDPSTTYVLAKDDMVYNTANGKPHQLIEAGSRSYTFDANGNMRGWIQPCSGGNADLVRELKWDAENRVSYIGQGSNDTDYRYNAEGTRTLERGPGGTLWFVNEHWRVHNDGHRYANIFIGGTLVASHRTSPASAAPPVCDPAVTTCTCDPGTQVCDCAVGGGVCNPPPKVTIHYLHGDLQGSLRVATDEYGDVFQYVEYLPTGRPWVAGQSRTKDTPFMFAGGWTDASYDMVNFGGRWYEPREEQFISPEPLLVDDPWSTVNDPSLLAAYTYAASNPLRFVDRDGRSSTAAGPFDLGKNNEKHLRGNFTISDARRVKRDSPAVTFGGRYSNNARGQALQASFQKYADRADRFTTILSYENDRKRLRVFGITVRKNPAPNPGPDSTGNAPSSVPSLPPSTPPPRPTAAAPVAVPAPAPAAVAAVVPQAIAPTAAPPAAQQRPRAASAPAVMASSVISSTPVLPASAAAMGADE